MSNRYSKTEHPPGGTHARRRGPSLAALVLPAAIGAAALGMSPGAQAQAPACIKADIVVFDSPTVFNRLGAQNPNWITYALRRDVVQAATPAALAADPTLAATQGLPESAGGKLVEGQVALRPDKRPRPLVVRSVEGKCLDVKLTNLLAPAANPNNFIDNPLSETDNALINNDQVAGRCAGFHATGTELRTSMRDDGAMVGANPGASLDPAACGDGLVPPGGSITYELYTPHEGAYVANSYGATIGSEANGGNLAVGMFAVLNVEPKGARMYRSQLTEEEMRLAATDPVTGLVRTVASDCLPGQTPGPDCNPGGQPILDYEAVYPDVEPWISEGKAGLPILNMLDANGNLVHSDINAIIAGPDADGSWRSVCSGGNGNPDCPYPLERAGKTNPQLPNRLEAFREFTSIFHDEQTNSQVFPRWYNDPVMRHVLHGVKDQFMINYASGGIGSEIIANRLHTGPMHDCTGCAYEEFFLASQTVGDPGLLVQYPANTGIEQCDPSVIAGPGTACWRDPVNLANGPIPGNYALFQADPVNVHHAYTGDFTKMRNTHVGAFEQHIFHFHNNQWLFNPNDDNANYLDAQEIMPGSGHTYELVNGGAGNRNKSVGDAIFHCHFYPHFAQGMWYHMRIKDVFETGTVLAASGGTADNPGFHAVPWALRSGQPMPGARALPDGELPDGVPIPAIVPMPGKAAPQMPAPVHIVAVDRGGHSLLGGRTGPDGTPDSSQAVVDYDVAKGPDGLFGTADDVSPGYPFWLAGNECGVDAPPAPIDGATQVVGHAACPKGIVGQRMATPPLDMLTEEGAAAVNSDWANLGGGWDGGLPRHALLGYVSGGLSLDTQNRLDFSKVIEMAQPVYFPETGTEMEQVSMAYQAVRHRPTVALNLDGTQTATSFVLNGNPAVPGGPFNDPCVDDLGQLTTGAGNNDWFNGDGDENTYNTGGVSPHSWKNPRTYKVANLQIDAVFNKVGHHYPQERIIILWEDVKPTVLKERPPEPLVMRFNTYDCGKILHANLVPEKFELDDFQVRTPTDIIGQHIHLPKWDLTTNDGAANGWNYEDGTLAPGMVRERIHAINEFNHFVEACHLDPAACVIPAGTLPGQLAAIDLTDLEPVPTIPTGDVNGTEAGLTTLVERPHPFFSNIAGNPQTGDYLGARTTIQRILVDPVLNVAGVDRGLGLTFSHDHYGPSTFQQIGLYSTILAEPAGSEWRHNETGVLLGGRDDGGPTSWQAAILPPPGSPVPAHREFYFEMSDFQHAYEAGVYVGADANGLPKKADVLQPDPFNATQATAPALADTWQSAVNPTLKLTANGGAAVGTFPDVVTAHAGCPGPLGQNDPNIPRPCPEAINIAHGSMWVINYRNEPVGLRVFDPQRLGPDGNRGTQTRGEAGDLAFAFQTRTDRAIPELNTSFGLMPYPTQGDCDGINCDRQPGDPITPIMRAYQRDHVKIKVQVGATEEQHQTTVHGMKWLSNGSGFGRSPNSGWRNFQSHGISEQFSLQAPVNPDLGQAGQRAFDTLYATDVTRDGIWMGTWGILRTYGFLQNNLYPLPNNDPALRPNQDTVVNAADFDGVCPLSAPVTVHDVTAVLANDVLPNALGVTIPRNVRGDSDGDGRGDNEGGQLNIDGGTLVYNRRGTGITVCDGGVDEAGVCLGVTQQKAGPLNDPTAIMYVHTADLVPNPKNNGEANQCANGGATNPACPVRLDDNAPVEPVVLRAQAGDCINVTLRNRLPAVAPDLAGWQDTMWIVKRDVRVGPDGLPQMHFFGNNLVRPSSHVGLHPQLVEYDVTRADGTLVGNNTVDRGQVAPPGGVTTYKWYAGDIAYEQVGTGQYEITATPVEFGGVNLLSADRIKQPQKGLFGALVIEPAGAAIDDGTMVPDGQANEAVTPLKTRRTRAQATITAPAGDAGSGGTYREALAIGHKITNLRWQDGSAIKNVHQAEFGVEGAEDMGHAGFNYGMEPSWFRFSLAPDAPFGNAGTPNSYGSIPNVHAFYSNALVAGEPNAIPPIPGVSEAGDPQTPVFYTTVAAGNPVLDTRMHVLNGASADRDGTFVLHGHVWQRDPFVCTGTSQDASLQAVLPGRCDPNVAVGSQALGLNPQAKYMGGEEGMGHVYGHWPILFDAGGSHGVAGDYLFRDYTPSGNRNGQFGILRVQPGAQAPQ